MRKRTITDRRTMEEHLLPPEAQTTELDYRTQPVAPGEDWAWARHSVIAQSVAFTVLALLLGLLAGLPLAEMSLGVLGLGSLCLACAALRYLARRPWTESLSQASGILAAWAVLALCSALPFPAVRYLVFFGPAVLCANWFGGVAGKQFAFWLTANPRVPRVALRRYRRLWPFLFARDRLRSSVTLTLAFAAGFIACGTCIEPVAVGVFLVSLAVLDYLLPCRGPIPVGSISLCRSALTLFLAYNRTFETTAAGVFRFPDEWCRETLNRLLALAAVLALGAAAVSSAPEPLAGLTKSRGKAEAAHTRSGLSALEARYAEQLRPEEKASYLRAVKQSRELNATAVTGMLRAVAVRAPFALVLPFVTLLLVMRVRVGRVLSAYYLALEAPNATEVPDGVNVWDNLVDRIMNSRNRMEREHVLVGFTLEDDVPMLVAREIFDHNVECYGGPGAGKTAVAIAPTATQLIARGDVSVLLLDLKGDPLLRESARVEAERARRDFWLVTNVVDRSSAVFNPLLQSNVGLLTRNQLTEGTSQALSLSYGPGFGEAFYSAMNEMLIAYYLRGRNIRSMAEFYAALRDPNSYQRPGGRKDLENARHVFAVAEKLAGVTPLNAVPSHDGDRPELFANMVDMPKLLSKPGVVYFSGNAILEETVTGMIAKLMLFVLLSAASLRKRKGRVEVYCFVDEFPVVVTDNLRPFLAESRSMGVHFFAASQTRAQLKRNSIDLSEVLDSTTFMKWEFHPHDSPTLKRIEETAPLATYTSLQWSQLIDDGVDPSDDDAFGVAGAATEDGAARIQVREETAPLPDRNTVIHAGVTPQAALVWFREHRGFTTCAGKWVPIVSPFHITKAEKDKREEAEWPPVTPKTLLVSRDDTIAAALCPNEAVDYRLQRAHEEQRRPKPPRA